MNRRFITYALGLGLLFATACTPTQIDDARPTASASPDTARADLLQALRKSADATYHYAVHGSLPDNGSITATGSIDPKAHHLQATETIRGTTTPSDTRSIYIGQNAYTRTPDQAYWVHVDLARVKKNNPLLHFDWSDPTGLRRFTSAITTVDQLDAHSYSGRFNPQSQLADPFLPVGAPAVLSIGSLSTGFTATTDAQGWVTTITVEVPQQSGPKLTLTTTLTNHGQPLKVSAPAGAHEADDIYYT